MPRLVASVFPTGDDWRQWQRLAAVLAYSAARHCPDWERSIDLIRPAPLSSPRDIPQSLLHNTQKMEHWYRAVLAAPDGAQLLLIDADTVILQPLDAIWEQPFDFAYTTKDSRFPFNSGVAFVRVSERSRAFISAWFDENRRLLENAKAHTPWRYFYGGINQASLGSMVSDFEIVEHREHHDPAKRYTKRPREAHEYHPSVRELHILKIPCSIWNVEDSCWPTFDPKVARILHVKSALRREVFSPSRTRPELLALVNLWRELDQQSRQTTAA